MASKVIGDLTGQRFGKLLVLSQADPIKSRIMQTDRSGRPVIGEDGLPVYRDGKMSYRAWRVKCDCGNELDVKESTLKHDGKYIPSCGCSKEENPKYSKKKTSPDEEGFDELYEYVRENVMKYPQGMKLSNFMVLRLKGMHTGQYLRNKKAHTKACYPYPVILNAFRVSSVQLQKALFDKSFIDEERKFSYICAIVERNLNSVFVAMQNNLMAKQRAQNLDVSGHVNRVHHYTPVTKKTNGSWLKEMEKRKQELDDLLRDDEDEPPLDVEALK